MSTGFSANAASIDGSANLLVEIAGLLYAGRLDGDTATMARAPRSHHEVGKAVEKFAVFADDQYQDLVTLLAALSTKLKETGRHYVEVDAKIQSSLDKILSAGYIAPPQNRQA